MDDERVVRPSPEGRAYRHLGCGGGTRITGNDFVRLANPHGYVRATFCAGCRRMAPPGEFVWADTGENVAAYRNRLKLLPALSGPRKYRVRMGIMVGLPVVLAGVGETLTHAAHGEFGVGMMFGAVLGFFLGAGIVLIMNRANPVDYRGYV